MRLGSWLHGSGWSEWSQERSSPPAASTSPNLKVALEELDDAGAGLGEAWRTGSSDEEAIDNALKVHRAAIERLIVGAAPLKSLPEPVDLDQYCVRRQARIAGLINEYRLVACRG
jgi:hypothetical protein